MYLVFAVLILCVVVCCDLLDSPDSQQQLIMSELAHMQAGQKIQLSAFRQNMEGKYGEIDWSDIEAHLHKYSNCRISEDGEGSWLTCPREL